MGRSRYNLTEKYHDRHIDVEAVLAYYENAQAEQNNGTFLPEMPEIPEGLNKETEGVLRAYKNMGTVWMNAGGCVPDPMPYLELLLIMHRNRLQFTRKSQW